MNQELFAFWKYDKSPYFLGGKIEEMLDDGKVKVMHYRGMLFTPVKILPFNEGEKLYNKILAIEAEASQEIKSISKAAENSICELIYGK